MLPYSSTYLYLVNGLSKDTSLAKDTDRSCRLRSGYSGETVCPGSSPFVIIIEPWHVISNNVAF